MRLRGRLDHLLDHHLRAGIGSVSGPLLALLRSGAYQLLEMSGVPAYAAVSESAGKAGEIGGRGAAGLVNAVLRAVGEAGAHPSLFPDPEAEPALWLATWGSHPLWLVERWLGRWDVERVRRLVEADNEVPPLTILPLRDDPATALERLAERGIDARPVEGGAGSIELPPGTVPGFALDAVPAVVQDPAATLVARYVAPDAGELVADLCAAPGGKALALAGGGRRVVAADRSPRRMRLVRENVARTGVSVHPVVALAEAPPIQEAGCILLDVPCTGTGTLRRHPDARWRLSPGDVEALTRVQDRILRGAADRVSSGGLLVYSTCTLEPEENEERIDAFLRDRPDFRVEPPPPGTVPAERVDRRGHLVVVPEPGGFDGAFAARLRRVGDGVDGEATR